MRQLEPPFPSGATGTFAWVSPEFVSLGQLPEVLGVSKTSAARYANRPDFPKPVDQVASGRLWRRKDVLAWKKNLPLRTGRPPKS